MRYGGWSRQWPAAYELSRLMEDPQVRADRSLVPALVKAFDEAKDGDPRIRRYLALAIGRLEPPLPKEAIDVLTKALDEPGTAWTPDIVSRINGWADIDINEARIMTIWALGSSGDASVVAKLVPFYESKDAGIRKMVVYALGALPGEAQLPTLLDRAEGRSRRRAMECRRRAGAARQRARACPCCGRCSIARSSSRRSSATCGSTRIRIRWRT